MNIPDHVAIIMDGNGRWATKKNLIRSAGHKVGAETVRNIVKKSSELGIKGLSLYCFSTENWARPLAEVDFLMKILYNFFEKEIDELYAKNVKIIVLGDCNKFEPNLKKIILSAIDRTKDNTGLILALALNYGSQDEIVMAANSCADDIKQGKISTITKDYFESKLYTSGMPQLDLLIRPGGEKRLSNFLLWQCAYAEFVFTDTLWPEFTTENFMQAIEEYSNRKRRFGKI